MVFINNILVQHEKLQEGYELNVNFKSSKTSTIKKTDKLVKCNGDLEVTRYYKGQFLCAVIIDCAEVESIVIKKED